MRHVWTDEHEKYIRNNIKGKTKKEMTEMFNKEFGTDVTTDKMKGFCSRKRIRSGVDCKFKKGVPSWNKSKSFPSRGRSSETQFKKGQKPDNTFPLGIHTLFVGTKAWTRSKRILLNTLEPKQVRL